MQTAYISGQKAYAFMTLFDYVREAGTAGEKTAALTILSRLKEIGGSPVIETFPIRTQKVTKVSLLVTEPYQKAIPVAGYLRSGSTPEEGIEAPLLYAEYGDDISLGDAKGKIVLLAKPMTPPLYEKVVKAGAVGFLTITGTPIDEGVDVIPLLPRTDEGEASSPETKDADPLRCYHRELRGRLETLIPGGVIHFNDATRLIESGAAKVRFTLQQQEEEATSANILCTIPGTDPVLAKEHISLTAHYDSVPQGKGAYDNLSSCSMVFELCRYFLQHPARRTIDCIWFGSEEKGLLGSKAYAAAHEEDLLNHRVNMNSDLAGQAVGGTVFGVTAEPVVEETLKKLAREIRSGMDTKNQVWSSDSNSFAAKGVPAVTLDRDGFGMHTRHDTLEYISPWALERDGNLLGYIADHLANSEEFPFERKVPEEYLEKLNAVTH